MDIVPFQNPREANWAIYKIELSARVTISGKRIQFVARIEKTTQMIKINMGNAFVESCLLNMPIIIVTPWMSTSSYWPVHTLWMT